MVEQRTICRTLSIAAAALLLAACAGRPTGPGPAPGTVAAPPSTATRRPSTSNAVTRLAMAMVGTPYRYGGATPDGFDCSGLVFYTYTASGYPVPRTSLHQYRAARKLRLSDARPGDLVFFQDQAQLSHVGIYLGNDRFVHAPASGRTVSVSRLSEPYYQMHLVGIGRLAELNDAG